MESDSHSVSSANTDPTEDRCPLLCLEAMERQPFQINTIEEATSSHLRHRHDKKCFTELRRFATGAPKAAHQASNHAHAQTQYAHLLRHPGPYAGSIRQDVTGAWKLYESAAKKGWGEGCWWAGRCCEQGTGRKVDKSRAVLFYRKGAALSHYGCLFKMVMILVYQRRQFNLTGQESRWVQEGCKWLKLAVTLATQQETCQDNYALACLYELAMWYAEGVPGNSQAAQCTATILSKDANYTVELLKTAAYRNYGPAQFRLAEILHLGLYGVKKDLWKAKYWYERVLEQREVMGDREEHKEQREFMQMRKWQQSATDRLEIVKDLLVDEEPPANPVIRRQRSSGHVRRANSAASLSRFFPDLKPITEDDHRTRTRSLPMISEEDRRKLKMKSLAPPPLHVARPLTSKKSSKSRQTLNALSREETSALLFKLSALAVDDDIPEESSATTSEDESSAASIDLSQQETKKESKRSPLVISKPLKITKVQAYTSSPALSSPLSISVTADDMQDQEDAPNIKVAPAPQEEQEETEPNVLEKTVSENPKSLPERPPSVSSTSNPLSLFTFGNDTLTSGPVFKSFKRSIANETQPKATKAEPTKPVNIAISTISASNTQSPTRIFSPGKSWIAASKELSSIFSFGSTEKEEVSITDAAASPILRPKHLPKLPDNDSSSSTSPAGLLNHRPVVSSPMATTSVNNTTENQSQPAVKVSKITVKPVKKITVSQVPLPAPAIQNMAIEEPVSESSSDSEDEIAILDLKDNKFSKENIASEGLPAWSLMRSTSGKGEKSFLESMEEAMRNSPLAEHLLNNNQTQ